jgi:DNA-binding CsgD family transcriptional regulator
MPPATKLIVAHDHSGASAALREAVTAALPDAKIIEVESIAALDQALTENPEAVLVVLGKLVRTLVDADPPNQHHGVEGSSTRNFHGRDPARNIARLTTQQRRVLVSLSNGHSNKTIAQNLGVTEATVKAHITVILRKLGLECRTQAALLAQRMLGGAGPTAAIKATAGDAFAAYGHAIEASAPDSLLSRGRSWGPR